MFTGLYRNQDSENPKKEMTMAWRKWKLGAAVSIILSLMVAGSGLAVGTTWKQFVAVFCAAAVTHFGSFLKEHPIESIETTTITKP